MTTDDSVADSIGAASDVATGAQGQRAHRDLVAHTGRLERRLYEVAEGVWSMVGNGLSNQNFVEGPDGLIVIDTGESRQEMRAALAEVRTHTKAPVAAVIYTHFHYVSGTAGLFDDGDDGAVIEAAAVPIWGHAGIEGNRERVGVELSAAAGRGLVHQFGIMLPHDGEDGLENSGLGIHFRNPEHAPYTQGYLPPTHTFTEDTSAELAGLRVELLPAPSDADDSITVWFPELDVAINNILWPALFNVFAIRGEEYRDPRILITGLEQLRDLGAEHLLCCHGPPMSGAAEIAADATRARDAIQFMWDQTVRSINQGLTVGEIAHRVQLPAMYGDHVVTTQFYGLVEHHVRQIHAGLRGWFDGDEAQLLPVPPRERAQKLIEGFGGAEAVRRYIEDALEQDDLRWALELATWLIRSDEDDHGRSDGGSPDDRAALGSVLRLIGQRTTSSNVRNWCLTRARELEGHIDLGRFRRHRFNARQVESMPPETHVRSLRVLLIPDRAEGLDVHIRWNFENGSTTGLHVRHQVAVPTDGAAAEHELSMSLSTWAQVVSGRLPLSDAIASGAIGVNGDESAVRQVLACFDIESLQA